MMWVWLVMVMLCCCVTLTERGLRPWRAFTGSRSRLGTCWGDLLIATGTVALPVSRGPVAGDSARAKLGESALAVTLPLQAGLGWPMDGATAGEKLVGTSGAELQSGKAKVERCDKESGEILDSEEKVERCDKESGQVLDSQDKELAMSSVGDDPVVDVPDDEPVEQSRSRPAACFLKDSSTSMLCLARVADRRSTSLRSSSHCETLIENASRRPTGTSMVSVRSRARAIGDENVDKASSSILGSTS